MRSCRDVPESFKQECVPDSEEFNAAKERFVTAVAEANFEIGVRTADALVLPIGVNEDVKSMIISQRDAIAEKLRLMTLN